MEEIMAKITYQEASQLNQPIIDRPYCDSISNISQEKCLEMIKNLKSYNTYIPSLGNLKGEGISSSFANSVGEFEEVIVPRLVSCLLTDCTLIDIIRPGSGN